MNPNVFELLQEADIYEYICSFVLLIRSFVNKKLLLWDKLRVKTMDT